MNLKKIRKKMLVEILNKAYIEVAPNKLKLLLNNIKSTKSFERAIKNKPVNK